MTGADILAGRGIPAEPVPGPSAARFPDGAHYRLEIPSVEGPEVLRAVVETAAELGVTVNRVSQGSGAMLLAEAELAEMARIAADSGLEVSLFVGPREEWDIGRSAHAPDGGSLAGQLRGTRQLRYAIDDILRAVDQGIRGFLIADTGLLQIVTEMQAAGQLPASVVWKVSAVLAPSNPVSLRQLEQLGGSTVNVPSDVTLGPALRDAREHLGAHRPVRGVPGRAGRGGARARGGRPDQPWRRRCTSSSGCATRGRCTRAGCTSWATRPRSAGRRCTGPRSRWSGSGAAGWS